MDPINEGAEGVAVEDIQDRLSSLGYAIEKDELDEKRYGKSTASAVARFRLDHDLLLGDEVDTATWAALVDECYQLGDRTLYLRLPNFHGNDVRQLQERLNVLGFSCGEVDGQYGAHTEAAVKQFQESMGLLADGMAFQDTFDAIDRLHHVWESKNAAGPHPQSGIGFARALNVLENVRLCITGDDPISRNVAGRIWNLASATTAQSGIELVDSADTVEQESPDAQAVFLLSTSPLPEGSTVSNVVMDDVDSLPLRLRAAVEGSREERPLVRIELPVGPNFDGTFTIADAQTYAVLLLDAICSAFEQIIP
ncbi:MAG: peptidoglycan-binding domain-containing protein [Tractidigestivibacter sp.]|jgi:peptidoglycan hydrolase-like protein with peptidoglycan-binding domain|uniref:peptidoglycan-binding domain-containing protein n=1 Tax=Tractidigestivibacter sp. TaxID=2847320 RepID=UPI003D8FF19F